MKIFQPFFIFLFAVLILACNKTPPPTPDPGVGIVELNIVPRMGGQLYEKDLIYENIRGRRLNWESIKLYISDFTLIKSDGTEEVLKTSSFDSEVVLFDFSEEEVKKVAHGDGIFQFFVASAEEYQGARLSFGVPEQLNSANPASYPSGHPLGDESGMVSGDEYAFLKMEGKIDSSETINGQEINHSLSYEIGGNSLYKTLEYKGGEHTFTVKRNEETQFILEIDLNRIFYTNSDTINMILDNQSSLKDNLSQKLMDNLTGNATYKVPF